LTIIVHHDCRDYLDVDDPVDFKVPVDHANIASIRFDAYDPLDPICDLDGEAADVRPKVKPYVVRAQCDEFGIAPASKQLMYGILVARIGSEKPLVSI